MLEVSQLSYSYRLGKRMVEVLKKVNLKVESGEFLAIQGPSGSGKSTLFYLLGLLLKPHSGSIVFDGVELTGLSLDELAEFRNKKIGFIFQQFHLLAQTTVLENILLPTHYPSEAPLFGPRTKDKAIALAKDLGLGRHLHHYPNQLSGGQQQRVAIARALMNDVDLILADEPTGNLDSQNAAQTMSLLKELNALGKTIILITHDSQIAAQCSRILHMRDGSFNEKQPKISLKISSGHKKSPNKVASLWPILRSTFPLAMQTLLRKKAQSLMTLMGVVIGVAAILATLTLGKFTQKKILETYEVLGINKVILRGYPNWSIKATEAVTASFRSFDVHRDFVPLQRVFKEVKYVSPILSSWRDKVVAGGILMDDRISALGVTSDYFKITNRQLTAGRFLSPFHVDKRSPVCVVGSEIAAHLFTGKNALDHIINITVNNDSSFPCKIIGVLKTVRGNDLWAPPNRQIFLPYTYFQAVSSSWWASQIHEGAIQVQSSADVELVAKKIRTFFEMKYGKAGHFQVDSDSTLIAQMKKFLKMFSLLITVIACLSLLVGGIGIHNMMLVSITERIKEFGLRKALGATDQTIRIQILLESLSLCGIAGVLGVLFGFLGYQAIIFGATKLIANFEFEWVIDPVAMLFSLFSIVVVGIGSGLVPALRAERLQVIEALRSE